MTDPWIEVSYDVHQYDFQEARKLSRLVFGINPGERISVFGIKRMGGESIARMFRRNSESGSVESMSQIRLQQFS